MKAYLILFIFFIVSGANFVSANQLLTDNICKSSSANSVITSNHSKGDNTNTPFADLTQIESEEEEEKLKNTIKKNFYNEFVFISPFSNSLPTKKNVIRPSSVSNLMGGRGFLTTSAPIYLRISVFRI